MNLKLCSLITMVSLFMLTLSLQKSFSQNSPSVDTAWVRHYSGAINSNSRLTALAIDRAGNVYVTGSSGASSNADCATIKYNTFGEVIWIAHYNGLANGNDDPADLCIDDGGNVYVTGMSEGIGSDRDFMTIKYNASGKEKWVARYNGPSNSVDQAITIAVDNKGNVYVAGGIDGRYHSAISWLILPGKSATIKYDESGNEQWVSVYEEPESELNCITTLAVDDSGNVYVGGFGYSFCLNSNIYYVIKYNSAGTAKWIAKYPGPRNNVIGVQNLKIDNSGNVYIVVLASDGISFEGYATIKYDASGNEKWVARFDGYNRPSALTIDRMGNVYVTGRSDSYGHAGYATIKYNSSGDELWTARYDCPGSADERPSAIAVDHNGNVYVTGNIGRYGQQDFVTIKYDSSGIEKWVVTYSMKEQSDNQSLEIAVADARNIYVAGTSSGDEWSTYTIIKYFEATTDVNHVENLSVPEIFSLDQNCPNPFNPSTTIEFALPKSAFVTLKVYNLLGEEVATLVAEQRAAGIHKLNWDAWGLASGVYLYRLEAGEFAQSKKLILLR